MLDIFVLTGEIMVSVTVWSFVIGFVAGVIGAVYKKFKHIDDNSNMFDI